MAILSESTKTHSGVNETTVYKLMNDASTDETKSDAIDVSTAQEVSVVVETGAGVSGGAVKLEGAITSDYSGTWAELGSITTSAASTAYSDVASAEGGTAGLPIPYVRARIETAISGGTIDVYIIVRR